MYVLIPFIDLLHHFHRIGGYPEKHCKINLSQEDNDRAYEEGKSIWANCLFLEINNQIRYPSASVGKDNI